MGTTTETEGYRVLRYAELRPTRWKNGGGKTTEIAAYPRGADLDSFDWRISFARMTADGAFSVFSEVERTLAVAEGAGLSLAVGDAPAAHLDRTGEPFRFPADEPCQARLLEGLLLPRLASAVIESIGAKAVAFLVAIAPVGSRR